MSVPAVSELRSALEREPRMSPFLRWHRWLPCLLVLLLAVSVTPAAALETVTLQLKWTHAFQFAGYYAAKEQGYYREAGLDVNILEATPTTDPVRVVLEGKAQYAVGTSSLILERKAGKPVVVLAVVFQQSPYEIYAAPDIHHLRDLIGKRLMMEPQAEELLAYLKKEGIPLDRIQLLPHSFDAAGLMQGKAEAISGYSSNEPYYFKQAQYPYQTFSPRSAGIDFYGDNLFTSEQELHDHPDRVRAFRAASLRGWTYAKEHRDEVIALILAKYSMQNTRDFLRFESDQMIPLLQPNLIEIGYMNPNRWRHIADTYAGLGLLPADYPLEGFLYNADQPDLTWVYRSLAIALLLIAGASGVAVFIYRINRRLVQTMEKRKEAEAALAKSNKDLADREAMLKQILDTSSVAIFLVDRDGRITHANQRMAGMFGWPLDELTGKEYVELIHPSDRDLGRQKMLALLASQIPVVELERHYWRADGTEFWGYLSGKRFYDVSGAELGLVGMISDISQRKKAEEAQGHLERKLQQAQKAESLARMAGAIAHHYNNLMGAVLGNLELALNQLPAGAQAMRNLAEAMKAAERAAEVSGLMLTYLGQTQDKQTPLDLAEICRHSLPILRNAMPNTAQLDVALPSPGPTIKANAQQLQQVLTNLAANAGEAIGDNPGAIHLAVSTVSSADLPAVHRFPADWQPQGDLFACLEIADDGCGIPAKDIDKLFDPFFTTRFTGRGLGLSVVLGVVRAHNGAITVTSEGGRGSVFRLYFPLSTETVQRPAAGVDLGSQEGNDGTILLVEDDQLVRKMAHDMLAFLRFKVLEAKDGIEAVAVFRQHQDSIRLVLSDLNMPGTDGWEMLAALRRLEPGIPVILTSGFDQAQVMAGDHAERPQAFLGKPYDLTRLDEVIRQVLGNLPREGGLS